MTIRAWLRYSIVLMCAVSLFHVGADETSQYFGKNMAYFLEDTTVREGETRVEIPRGSTRRLMAGYRFIDSAEEEGPLRIREKRLELLLKTREWSGWVPAEHVAVNGLVFNGRYAGQRLTVSSVKKQVTPAAPSVDYVETIKQLYLIDVKTGEVLDRHQLKRNHDYVSFHRSSVKGYIAMRHEYDRFNTLSIGYEGVFLLPAEEFALDAPALHFYRLIGSQDMPYAELRELEATPEMLRAEYEYYESIGRPELGYGTAELIYTRDEGVFRFDELRTAVSLEPAAYGGEWPFRGAPLMQDRELYMGQGWYPVSGGYRISIRRLNRKFFYYRETPSFIWGIEDEFPASGTVNDDHLRVRAIPTLEGEILGKLFEGDEVTVLDRTGRRQTINERTAFWYKLRSEEFEEGWSFGAYIDLR